MKRLILILLFSIIAFSQVKIDSIEYVGDSSCVHSFAEKVLSITDSPNQQVRQEIWICRNCLRKIIVTVTEQKVFPQIIQSEYEILNLQLAEKQLAKPIDEPVKKMVTQTPITPEPVIQEIKITSEAQAVLDYLRSIPENKLALEKPDIQELWKGYTPIQTQTVWRNDVIKMWMDLNGCYYANSWTKAKLLEAVKACLGE